MATQRPALDAARSDFAARLLAEREVGPRAQVIAKETADLTGGSAAVYLYNAAAAPRWSAKASVGDITAPASCEALTLHMLSERLEGLLFAGHELVREHYAHLDVRRTVAAMAYVPLVCDGRLLGAIEVISFDRVLGAEDLEVLGRITHLSAVALASALGYEDERNSSLQSITRLTQFYDLEKVFHSTLQMSELMPIITAKIRELFDVQAVSLWMVDGDDLVLMSRHGADPTMAIGDLGDDIINVVADKGTWIALQKPSEPQLQARNAKAGGTEPAIRTLLATPIIHGDAVVGVLECVNKSGGARFTEEDLFFLTTVAESASLALHNASLLEAERKIEILETLVEVSAEITSTLNLERVLQVVVNGPQRIMAYERAALALDTRGKLQLRAISGVLEIVQSDPKVQRLRELLEWSATFDDPVHVTMHGQEIEAEREETREKFRAYFADSGMRGWYAIPLADEQGRLGVLSFESRDPDFLTEAHLEFLKVVAAQATVALRNASLYEEVPFIGVLEPLLQKKQQFLRMEKRRRTAAVVLAAAAVLFLLFFPLPMRVEGTATVAPQRSARIDVNMDGVVRTVHVREGDPVKRGTILAELEDWEARSALASAEAKRDAALSQMNRALAGGDGGEAGMRRVEAEYWTSEVTRARERLEQTRLRSPIDGVVSTPYVENMVGRSLKAGDTFAEVVDNSHTSVDVTVDQQDLPLVSAGQAASLKLESYPTRRFRGQVALVSPVSSAVGDQRVFYARVDVPNAEGMLRAGMLGQGKVFTGWRPAGYVMFRGVGMWTWSKFWSWFGG